MFRRSVTLTCAFLGIALLAVADRARGQDKKDAPAKAEPVSIKVILPRANAQLSIQGQPTRQTGTERTFVSPPLEPGREYEYKMIAVWEPNNYTKITRQKMLKVKAAQNVEVDFRTKDEGKEDDILVRWVPTPPEIVDKMCELGKIGKEDVVFDLGCGDGIMVIRAVKNFGAKKGIGVDINPDKVRDAQAAAKRAGVEDRVVFREGDVLKPIQGLDEASAILLYMGDDLNNALKPILLKTLKPGTRIISHRFKMGDWAPDKTITVKGNDGDEYLIHLWTIPAKKGE
jgi:uncharacterized protein (TIGR03000 family)